MQLQLHRRGTFINREKTQTVRVAGHTRSKVKLATGKLLALVQREPSYQLPLILVIGPCDHSTTEYGRAIIGRTAYLRVASPIGTMPGLEMEISLWPMFMNDFRRAGYGGRLRLIRSSRGTSPCIRGSTGVR